MQAACSYSHSIEIHMRCVGRKLLESIHARSVEIPLYSFFGGGAIIPPLALYAVYLASKIVSSSGSPS